MSKSRESRPQEAPLAGDFRLHAPATGRNRGPIAEVLSDWLPQPVQTGGQLLELASGTGEHAVSLATRFPGLTWQPSDPDPDHRRSIDAYRRIEGPANLLAPLDIDVTQADWPLAAPVDVMVCCNMIHIYGPFKRAGMHTAPSNAAFDVSLRQRDPTWGVRDLDDVAALAAAAGLAAPEIREMPANNLSLWFARHA